MNFSVAFSTDTVFTEAEVVAGRPRPCGKTEFTCSNQRCIPIQLQCDLFSDCGDGGSDEQDCKACKCQQQLTQADRSKKNSEEMKSRECHDDVIRTAAFSSF